MTNRLGHVPALDGIRGLAILLVLASHFAALPGDALGVDLFFVLSGFLITSLLLDEWLATGTIRLGAFFGRRARRLLPALFAMLACYLALEAFRGDQRHALLWSLLAAGYVTNVAQAFEGVAGQPLSHLWSLAQEEQFYLLWPPLLLALLRDRVRLTGVMLVLAGGIVGVATWRTFLTIHGAHDVRLWMGPDVRGDAMMVGCAAAVARRLGSVPGWVGWAALPALVFLPVVFRIPDRSVYPWLLPLFALAAAALVLTACNRPGGALTRLLSAGLLRWFGGISYALYLWHYMLLSMVPNRPLGFVLSILAAWCSARYIERPFMRWRPIRAASPPASAPT
jgi:peptidoglycan/LPS O-acetylase OafA/YrhL